MTIDFDTWVSTYKPVLGRRGGKQTLATVYVNERKGHIGFTFMGDMRRSMQRRKANPRQVWTIVEGDSDGAWWLIPGIHFVNVIGYALTENEWTRSDIDVEWD